MKKILLVILFLSLFMLNVHAENKIAVVDLQKVVASSSQVKALKHEHAAKIVELNKLLEKARNEIMHEKDGTKIIALEDKYTKEFNDKKNKLEDDYNKKLNDIENNIKSEIVKNGNKGSYDYIFAKSVVLFGGEDITNDIIQNIK